MFLLNSRLGLFTAAPLLTERPFSRSYGAILPSSLATDHSSALGYSPRLPVSVYGTGCAYLKLRDFSWKHTEGHYHLALGAQCTIVFQLGMRICLHSSTPTHFNLEFRLEAGRSCLRRPIAVYTGTGILTRLPSASPFGYTLGPD